MLGQISLKPPAISRSVQSKLHWRLATIFHSIGNVKDGKWYLNIISIWFQYYNLDDSLALHQLRCAVQLCPADGLLLDYYRKVVGQTGFPVNIELDPVTEAESNKTVEEFLQGNTDLALNHLIKTPCCHG